MNILLTDNIAIDKLQSIEPVSLSVYMAEGGYQALTKALKEMQPADVIREVKTSGLRGRGGGGFPTGRKWELVYEAHNYRKSPKKYVACNAAEGEPGTLKDRVLIRSNPHQLIEGVILAAYAIGADEAVIYINSREDREKKILEKALLEAEERGFSGDRILGSEFNLRIRLFKAEDRYIAGEETAMLEAIEGRPARPRIKPPFPSLSGLYGKPTLINNVETLSNIPHIIKNGGEWFSVIGTPHSPGTKLFTITGDVDELGVYELPMGIPLRELLFNYGRGIKGKEQFKAAFPGGPSTPVITDIDIPMDFDSLAKADSTLGSGGVIVFGGKSCMVRAAREYAGFFKESSCGLCPPCVNGPSQLVEMLSRLENGDGEMGDLDSIREIADFIRGRGYCHLVTGASLSVASLLASFGNEFIDHISAKGCPFRDQ